MTKSKEIIFIKNLMLILGRKEKEKLLENSNLDDREKLSMELRFIHGFSFCETAEKMNIPFDTFSKFQKRVFIKLYIWLQRQANIN